MRSDRGAKDRQRDAPPQTAWQAAPPAPWVRCRGRGTAKHVQAVADHRVLDLAQVPVHVDSTKLSNSTGAGRPRPRAVMVQLRGRDSSHTWARTAGSWPGPVALTVAY